MPLASRLAGFVALTKPRIVELLLVTTVPAMFVASRTVPSFRLVVLTVVGGAFAAGGANAFNMFYDRDIDAIMHRTRRRPLVSGSVSPSDALALSVALEVGAFLLLWLAVNMLSALLALAAALFYVGVYTMWLKRRSPSNIVIGGAAGAVPVLVGWSAVTGHLGAPAWVMFGIVFAWTPPHFWALAIARKHEYARAGIPMLPVTHGVEHTRLQILLYSVLLALVTLLPFITGMSGLIYLACVLVLDARFLYYAVRLKFRPRPQLPMQLFRYSISYLMWLFAALLIDHYLPTTQLLFRV